MRLMVNTRLLTVAYGKTLLAMAMRIRQIKRIRRMLNDTMPIEIRPCRLWQYDLRQPHRGNAYARNRLRQAASEDRQGA